MKKTILLALVIISSFTAQAQDSTKVWKFTGKNNLSIGSTALSNWSAGGENALSLTASIDYQYNYKKGKNKIDNRLIMMYGLNKQGTNEIAKTDDRIDFTTLFGHQATKDWFYVLEINFKTQFTEGYEKDLDVNGDKVVASNFMAPGYLTISPGMEYEPNENFKLTVSPVSTKTTFVNNDFLSLNGAYGVEKGERTRVEFGAYVNMNWKKDFNDHFGMEHLLRLYSNYLSNPQNVDVDYTANFYIKATKYIEVNFLVQAIYDDDVKIASEGSVGPRLQLKSVLGVGLSYHFE